jgi:WD40 repeat protein
VNSVAIANSNRDLIVADESGIIKIWDINKEYISNPEEEGGAFRSIAISDSEGFLVGAKSSGVCYVFDYGHEKDLKLLTSFTAHNNYITKCVLSPKHK